MQDRVQIVEADLARADHQDAVVRLIDAYARDPMGTGRPLPDSVRQGLIPALRRHPTTLVFLAFVEQVPVGIAVCFLGMSTFAARPLINIHDLAVLPEHRGQGTGRRLLEQVIQKARELGCCKVTLEVREDNRRARRLYETMGFAAPEHVNGAVPTFFLAKML
ncbi:MAG: GNAT family N-acetyltransferase [Planctomycetes bacterium]|nr:GNAT family N-acetyltransferase [Planctomycetota bacterium]